MADKTLKENLASLEDLIGSLEQAGINVEGIKKAFFDEVVPQAEEPAEEPAGDMSVKEMLRRLDDPREAHASDDPVTDADLRKRFLLSLKLKLKLKLKRKRKRKHLNLNHSLLPQQNLLLNLPLLRKKS